MSKAQINGKVHLKGYTLLVITVPHDFGADLRIFEELFDTIENYGIDNGLKYVEIVKRIHTGMGKYAIVPASQYTILMEKTKFK